MASDNLMTMEQPWSFRPTFGDAWISDIFNKENETLTKALQRSFTASSSVGDVVSSGLLESLFAKPEITPVQTPTVSGGSENDAPVYKQPPRRTLTPTGRVTKRKSRASKQSTTTFITADPANFRQMVQEVTGVRFAGLNGQIPGTTLLKPEPQRTVNRLQPGASCLPTLDSSAFLLDAAAASLISQPPPPSTVVPDGAGAGAGHDFDSFCSFPTLESWKVM